MIRKGAYLLCGLLIIACSLYATEDDYDARKAEMVRRNGTKGNIIRLTNDYIGVAIDDTTGQFGVGISRTSLDTMLTYGYPDIVTTSHTIFNVDNLSTCDYTNNAYSTIATYILPGASDFIPFEEYPTSGDSSYVEGGWVIDDIRFIQRVRPVYLVRDYDGATTGSAFIQYFVTNLGSSSHQIGVRLLIDTYIGTGTDGNDAAPISTIYGYSATDNVWISPDIPGEWSAYKDQLPGGLPDPDGLKATGYLTPDDMVPDAVTPDRFAAGQWLDFVATPSWYYTATGNPYNDSAVLLWWERTLAPGETDTFGTYYGLGLRDVTPPEVALISPSESVWTACEPETIKIMIRDEQSVNDTTIKLEVDGVVYTVDSTDVLHWYPADTLLTFVPRTPFQNGDIIIVSVRNVADMEGNAIDSAYVDTAATWVFFIDYEPPVISNLNPSDGSTSSLLPTITCNIFDYESGVDSSSLVIWVNGVPYDIGTTPGMTYDTITGDFVFDFAAAGFDTFGPGAQICCSLCVFDRPDTCDPHLGDTSWCFTTRTFAPTPVLMTPGDGDTSVCDDEEIWIRLISESGVDSTTIVLRINDDFFTIDDDELVLLDDTLKFNIDGTYPYQTGLVTICLGPIADSVGVMSSDSTYWSFYIDLTPPIMENPYPTSPPLVEDLTFTISMDIVDVELPLPIDEASIEVTLYTQAGEYTVEYDDFTSGWADPTFSFPANISGAQFTDGEVVTVRLRVRDLPPTKVSPYTIVCAGNLLDTTFTFQIAATPCKRSPNPITPGISPDKNDETVFQFPNMRMVKAGDVHIYIYDLRNNLIAEITEPDPDLGWCWDGTDQDGSYVGQGTYIYLIKVENETPCTGTISVAR